MDIRPAFQLQVMIKAMEDVVLPAVSPELKMAHEQAGLILATLRTLEKRLPLWYRYDRDELERFLALSDEVLALPGTKDAAKTALAAAAQTGADVLDRARADPAELEAAIFALREGIGGMMMAEQDAGEKPHRTALGRLVLRASRQQLERERAWLITSGFESDPESIEPIESQLAK